MAKKSGLMDYINILIRGVIFWFVAYFLTIGLDPDGKISGITSIIFGLFIIYLEILWYRYKNFKR